MTHAMPRSRPGRRPTPHGIADGHIILSGCVAMQGINPALEKRDRCCDNHG